MSESAILVMKLRDEDKCFVQLWHNSSKILLWVLLLNLSQSLESFSTHSLKFSTT